MIDSPPEGTWLHFLQRTVAGPAVPLAVAGVLAVALGWQVAGLAWKLAPQSPASLPATIAERPGTGGSGVSEASATERLARLHLFGSAPTQAAASDRAAEEPTDAPRTQLDLVLKGVYAVGTGDGLAIIVAGRGKETLYAPGESLPGNARIASIHGDRVLLRRDSGLEVLWLTDPPERPRSSRDNGRQAMADPQQIGRIASALRERLLENPMELARMVRFQPYQQDGRLIGFRLQPRGDHAQLLRELGLTSQDVLTRVNDVPLDDTRRANEALRDLQTTGEIRVEFLRDGAQHSMTIPIGPPG